MPGFQTVQMSGEIEPLITFVSSQRKAHTNSTSTFNFQSGDCNLSFSEQEMNPTVRRSRPNSTCEMRSHTREQSPSPARHIRDDNQTQAYSTVRRTSSPFRKPVNVEIGLHSRRPPLPRTYQRWQSDTSLFHRKEDQQSIQKTSKRRNWTSQQETTPTTDTSDTWQTTLTSPSRFRGTWDDKYMP